MNACNNAEVETPNWMNKEFILTILKSCEPDGNIEITDLEFSPGSEKGDHFASIVLRAVVDYVTPKGPKSKSMVIKTLPDSFMGEMLAKSQIFETEIKMYSEIIPKMEAELRKHGDHTQLGAKALFHSLSPRKVIVFEDLCSQGYRVVRGRFLNMVETRQTLLLLAKWHAVSFKLALEGDESIKSCDQGLFNYIDPGKSALLGYGINRLIESLSTLKGFEVYADKLRSLEPAFLQNCSKIYNAYKLGDRQSILVLNHGDFHMKNVMFRSVGDRVENVLFVDFQLCTYAPSIIDVIYSIFTSFSPEIRQSHREELTYYYFENFLETLRKIEFQGALPTHADFNIDLITHREFEIFAVSALLISSLKSVELEFGATKSIESSDSNARPYRHPTYVKELKKILPRLLDI